MRLLLDSDPTHRDFGVQRGLNRATATGFKFNAATCGQTEQRTAGLDRAVGGRYAENNAAVGPLE
jgi:hypothetical protein